VNFSLFGPIRTLGPSRSPRDHCAFQENSLEIVSAKFHKGSENPNSLIRFRSANWFVGRHWPRAAHEQGRDRKACPGDSTAANHKTLIWNDRRQVFCSTAYFASVAVSKAAESKAQSGQLICRTRSRRLQLVAPPGGETSTESQRTCCSFTS